MTRLLSFHSQSESQKLCQPFPPTNSASVIHGYTPECETNTHSCVLYYISVISLKLVRGEHATVTPGTQRENTKR